MKIFSLLTAMSLGLGAMSASADVIELNSAQSGATLREAGVDMSVYWTEVDAGLEVVATYLETEAQGPERIVMVLAKGDAVTFSLPGRLDHSYRFSNSNDVLRVESRDNAPLFASN